MHQRCANVYMDQHECKLVSTHAEHGQTQWIAGSPETFEVPPWLDGYRHFSPGPAFSLLKVCRVKAAANADTNFVFVSARATVGKHTRGFELGYQTVHVPAGTSQLVQLQQGLRWAIFETRQPSFIVAVFNAYWSAISVTPRCQHMLNIPDCNEMCQLSCWTMYEDWDAGKLIAAINQQNPKPPGFLFVSLWNKFTAFINNPDNGGKSYGVIAAMLMAFDIVSTSRESKAGKQLHWLDFLQLQKAVVYGTAISSDDNSLLGKLIANKDVALLGATLGAATLYLAIHQFKKKS